ncbi:MAG: two-component regulator propeller domain-containing protein [Candidatus Eisenbacteria bacterium]
MRHLMVGLAGILVFVSTARAADWEVYVNSNGVTTLWLDEGRVRWGSVGGLVTYDPATQMFQKTLKSVGELRSNRINAVATDAGGRVWIGTAHEGVCISDNSGWQFENTGNLHLLSDDVLDIAVSGGRVAVGTSGGVSLFQNDQFIRFFNGNDWGNSGCDSVLAVGLNDQAALVGTGCGLFAYSFDTGTWNQLIQRKRAYRIAYDNQSLFWIVASDSVYTYDGSLLRVISRRFIETALIRDIGAEGSAVWVAANSGPWRYDSANRWWVQVKDGLPASMPDDYMHRVRLAGGQTWIGTKNGAAFLQGNTWTLVQSAGPASNYIEDLCIDGTGDVWFTTGYRFRGGPTGSDQGILRYRPSTLTWNQLMHPDIPSNRAYPCETNPVDGSVWFGFWESTADRPGGLIKYDPQASVWTSYRDSVRTGVISDIYIDGRGNVAFGEYLQGMGVRRADGAFVHYSKDEIPVCLSSVCVTAVGPGPGGTYMIGNYFVGDTECKAEVVNLGLGGDFKNKNDDLCKVWGSTAGWPQGIATYAFALDPYGIVWLGSGGGLGAYDPGCGRWHRTYTRLGSVWDVKIDRHGDKWVGSDLGLYVLKGYGVDWGHFGKIEFFDNSNSPLEAAPVKAIAFDADGALWIGTAGAGIYRYHHEVPEPRPKVWINVYPNPYIADNDGCKRGIGFSGFSPGSMIRIYTLAGDFLGEFDPEKPWDTTNAAGKEIISGVYVYVGRAQDGSDFKGRFVIVR